METALKKNQIFTDIVSDFGFAGEGIVKLGGFPVFIPFALVGEEIEFKIVKVLSSHAFGKLLRVIKPSPHRVQPACPVYSRCGGCQMLHISYEKQLEIKKNRVIDCMKKYAGADIAVCDVLPASKTTHYRNKAQYPTDGEKCGFYAQRSHDIIPIDSCLMQNELDEKIISSVMAYIKRTGAPIRNIYMRYGDGECMVTLVSKSAKLPFSKVLAQNISKLDKCIRGVVLNVNPKDTNVILGDKYITLWGENKINASIGEIAFEVSPASFFQVNPYQTENLYSAAKALAGFDGSESIADLYCGIGSIGLFMADSVKSVVGVETVEAAIENARVNAKKNGISNISFICGDSEEVMPRLAAEGKAFDAVIVDPPRKGCAESLLTLLKQMQVPKILYISCNPATLARDIKILSDTYTPSAVTPVDMFPNTGHVECVALLTLSAAI